MLSPERVTLVGAQSTNSAVQVAEGAGVGPRLEARLRDLLAQLDRHEGCVPGHSASVCELAVTVARGVGVAEDELPTIALGALMHDVGKVFIDSRVLAKPAPLSAGQWEMIRLHPALGEAALQPTLSDPSVLGVVRSHHERWDGTGYPDGLGGEATPLAARIVATADAYTAMREPRAYRAALSKEDALDELERKSWTQFDGSCVRALVESLTDCRAGARQHGRLLRLWLALSCSGDRGDRGIPPTQSKRNPIQRGGTSCASRSPSSLEPLKKRRPRRPTR